MNKDIIIQDFLEGVKQTHNSAVLDMKYGCGKIRDYKRKRLCRLQMKIKILHKRFALCNNPKCQVKIKTQIAKWQEKYRNELLKLKINMNPSKV